jgi:iron complex transport system substrate-binding protein
MAEHARRLTAAVLAAWIVTVPAARAEVAAVDDSGATVTLAQPARRIVSLAPHVTELLFAAGAGARVVGVVDYSDYPDAAKQLRRVGSYAAFDLEAIVALQPDLVVGWSSGNPASQLDALRAVGLKLYLTEPRHIEDISVHIERLGALAGTAEVARASAGGFRARYTRLRQRYAGRPAVPVFYQIWDRPLMTVNGAHIISDVMRACGGRNVFASLAPLAAAVDREAVLAADPEAIIVSGMAAARPEHMGEWRRWPMLRAVKKDNLFFIPPDILQRHSPRLLQGAEQMCADLEIARSRR